MAKRMPGLAVGIHLNYSDLRDTASGNWTDFPSYSEMVGANLRVRLGRWKKRIREETDKQFRAYLGTGLPLAFVTSHHHLHIYRFVAKEVQKSLDRFVPGVDYWIREGSSTVCAAKLLTRTGRLLRPKEFRWGEKTTTDHILLGALKKNRFETPAECVQEFVQNWRDGFLEVVFHPGANKANFRGKKTVADDGQDRSGDLDSLLALAAFDRHATPEK